MGGSTVLAIIIHRFYKMTLKIVYCNAQLREPGSHFPTKPISVQSVSVTMFLVVRH